MDAAKRLAAAAAAAAAARMEELERELRDARDDAVRCKSLLEEGAARETALKAENEMLRGKLKELDVFRLDAIARELKKLETEITDCKQQAQGLVTHAKTLSGPMDKESTGNYSSRLNESLIAARAHMKVGFAALWLCLVFRCDL